jgi:hypothetical protein
MRNLIVPLLVIALLPVVQTQVSAPPPRTTGQPAPGAPASLQPAPMPDISSTLARLNQVVEQSRVDLARLRVDKWKADSSIKRQAESNADSVQRNLTTALPSIVQHVRANPGSLSASFKLYRNLNALYDVMTSLTESAGAFGSKDEYQALNNDTANLDSLRRSLADQVEAMANARDIEVAQLQARARQAAAEAAATAPPKKIIIDDTEPAKKPAKRTTTKKKPAAATSSQQQQPQTPPRPQ